MVREYSFEVPSIDPLLDPRNPVDPHLIAVRKLHYHPEHIGEMDAANPAEAASKAGAPPCETAPTPGSDTARDKIQVGADVANAPSQVGASSCESVPTPGGVQRLMHLTR